MLERIQKTEVFFFVLALAEMLLWVAMVIPAWGNSNQIFIILQWFAVFVAVLSLLLMQVLRLVRKDLTEHLHRSNEEMEELNHRLDRLEEKYCALQSQQTSETSNQS